MIRLLINVISTKLDEIDKSLIRNIIQWVSTLGATLGIDETTGMPKIEISAKNNISEKTLEETFRLTELVPKKIFVVAIDEFQQIINYPETNTEAIFRSITQQYPSIRFIFSGSSRHLMDQIFTSTTAPFYQSTENVSLDYINEKVYENFAKKFLPKCDSELIGGLIKWCRSHTYYVQFALNVLYEHETSGSDYTLPTIKSQVLKAHEFYYYSVRKLVSHDQWKILKAIAQHAPVGKPTSIGFSSILGIAQSTLKYNLDQLVEKDLILREKDGYKIYNVFLGHLLSITKT
ncbi:MAG: winged helix-turn-helix domain-containing protein [Cyclobacteriaceae bacterium]